MDKRLRFLRYLNEGKTLSAAMAAKGDGGEPITRMASIWRNEAGSFRVNIEVYLDKHAMCEQLYLRDDLVDFADLEEAVAYIERETGIRYIDMHA
jgi:hypothetical protein